jgi:hypothetical protein
MNRRNSFVVDTRMPASSASICITADDTPELLHAWRCTTPGSSLRRSVWHSGVGSLVPARLTSRLVLTAPGVEP